MSDGGSEPLTDAVHGKQTRAFQLFLLPLLRLAAWVLMTLLGPFKRVGNYRIPRSGGVLILSNHLADVDPIAVQLACPRPIYFMAKSELFHMKGVGAILRLFKAFSVKRGEPDRAAIRRAVALLRDGEAVCVFPEGELSETGELLPLKPGVALIVRMAQVPVICLGIIGTQRILPYGKMIPRPAFSTVRATWGELHSFGRDASTESILEWSEGQLRSLTGQER